MRVLRISTILCFLAVALAFCAGQAYTRFFLDETAPVISVDQATVQTSVEDPQSTLLDHVSAYDDHDGDLSGEVMLGGISKLISDNTAKATFYVFDDAGNMAAASCYVQYTDYHKPTFKLGAPLSFRVGSDISLTNKLSAYDVIDGEISDSIRVSATDINISVAGIYSFSVQVTNSLGDTAYLTLPLLITDAPADAPEIYLSDYLLELPCGSQFDPGKYVVRLESEGQSLPTSEVSVDSTVDPDTPGNYYVSYQYTDSLGRTGISVLAVIVEEV